MTLRTSLTILALAFLIGCDDNPAGPSQTPSATISIVSGASTLTTTALQPEPRHDNGWLNGAVDEQRQSCRTRPRRMVGRGTPAI